MPADVGCVLLKMSTVCPCVCMVTAVEVGHVPGIKFLRTNQIVGSALL